MPKTKTSPKSKTKKPRANLSPLKKLRNKPKFRVLALTLVVAALGVGGYFVFFSKAASTNNYIYVADWANDQIKVVNADTQDLVTKIDTSEVAYGKGPVNIIKNPRTTSSYANKAIVQYGTKGMGGCCGVSSGTPEEFGILDVKTNSITKKIDINKYTGVSEKTMQILGIVMNPARDEAYISTVYKTTTGVDQGRILIFSLASDTITGKIETTDASYSADIAVNSTGTRFYQVAIPKTGGSQNIYEYDIATKANVKKISLGTFSVITTASVNVTNNPTVSPSMNFILLADAKLTSASAGKTIKVFDMTSDTFTKTITLPEQFQGISIITNAAGNKVYFKDVSSQKMYAIDGDLISSKNVNSIISGYSVYLMPLPVKGVNPSPVTLSDDGTKTYVTDISSDAKTSYLSAQNSTSYVSLSYTPTTGTNSWPITSNGSYSDKLTDTIYPYSATYFQINDSSITAPTITSPVANSTLTGKTASLMFTAGDPFGLNKHEVFVDGKLNDTMTDPIYGGNFQYNWLLYLDKNKDGTAIGAGNHIVTVRVTDSNNNVATSAGVTYNFNNGVAQPDTTPPAVPAGLKSSSVSSSSISLAWTKNAETDLAGYQIHYREASSQTWNSNAPSIAQTASETYQLTGLKPDTSYVVQIRAYDGNGNYSAYSGDVSVKTSKATTTISAPTGLRTNPNNFGQNPWIYLTYNSVSGATSYNLYRDNSKIQSGIRNATMVDMTASPLVSHTYKMTAIDANGKESAPSSAISAKCSWFIWWFCQ